MVARGGSNHRHADSVRQILWSARIKALLTLHCVKLVDVNGIWVVRVGNDGPVEVDRVGILSQP